MTLKTPLLLAGLSLLAPFVAADDAGSMDAKVAAIVKAAQPALEALAAQPGLAAETEARDKEAMSDEAAKTWQARWTAPGAKDIDFKAYLDNQATPEFKKAMKKVKGLSKLFSLDKNGNVVATVPKCHDFVHGFEPKFSACFKSGQMLVNKPALDLTSKKYSVQISVPIKDASGTIGVLVGTFGIK
jgi:hypothetical protein